MKKGFLFLIFLLSAIISLLWGKSTNAAEYTAANPADLRDALTAAQGNGLEDIINLEPGVYDLSGGKLTYEVAGGGNLTIKPVNTGDVVLLDGGSASRILEITNTGGSGETVTIRGITFQNGIGTALNAAAPDIVIENCKFIDNKADIDGLGGGAQLTGTVTLTNNLFDGNQGFRYSCGGVTIGDGPVLLDSNIFVGNYGGGVQFYGGGVCIALSPFVSTDITLTNNVFDANTCSYFYGCPGGLYVTQSYGGGSTVTVTNNTFINNTSKQSGPTATAGAVIALPGGTIYIYNNIFWNNFDSSNPPVLRDLVVSIPDAGILNVAYNLFSSDTSRVLSVIDTVSNNIDSQDPGLTADYHLPAGASPAKDSGANNAPGRPDHDFEGDPRPATSEDIVDIGADEFTPPPEAGDINNDGVVNLTDAILSLMVLSNVAPPDSVFKEADIDANGIRIGLEEAIHALQSTSELRIPPDNSFMSIKRTGIGELIPPNPE